MLVLTMCLSGCRKNAASDTEDSAESAPAVEPISEEAEETGSPEPETDDGQTEETAVEENAGDEPSQEDAAQEEGKAEEGGPEEGEAGEGGPEEAGSEEGEAEEPETEVIETNVPEDGDFTVGIIADGAYRNSFLWIRFVPEEGWSLNDQTVMMELNSGVSTEGITTVAQYAGRVREELNGGGLYYDLCAEDEKDFMNAIVAIQKIPLVSGQHVDHEDVLQQSREVLTAMLQADGADEVDTVITTCGFLRSHQSGLWFHVRTPATDYAPPQDLFGRQVHRIHGPYDAVITVTSIGEDRTQELLDHFHAITE